jgi:hypothetical protein
MQKADSSVRNADSAVHRADSAAHRAETTYLASSARLLDRLEQVVRSVEYVLGPAARGWRVGDDRPDQPAGPPPVYMPSWGCSRCDTRWVALWPGRGRPSCWCCERDDLVYGV